MSTFLDNAIREEQKAITDNGQSCPYRGIRLNNLAGLLHDRYLQTKRLGDLDDAIRIGQEAVTTISKNGRTNPANLNHTYGNKSTGRFGRGYSVYPKGFELLPTEHPLRPEVLNCLGTEFYEKYANTGDSADLETCIRVTREAVDSTPTDNIYYVEYVQNLSMALGRQHSISGSLFDLDNAISVQRQLLEVIPEGDLNYIESLLNLGTLLGLRFSSSGTLSDMTDAVEITQQAVDAMPINHPHRASSLNGLANRLSDRYSMTGDMKDLQHAISLARAAVGISSNDDPDRISFMHNISIFLHTRYSRLGAMVDLDEAIQTQQECVEMTPRHNPEYINRLRELGNVLDLRYARFGAMVDLEETIKTLRNSIQVIEKSQPMYPRLLLDLGSKLSSKYSRTNEISQLDEAITLTKESMNAIAADHPERVMSYNQLGVLLGIKFSETGLSKCLKEAIELAQTASGMLPKDHPDRPMYLSNLASRLGEQYAATEDTYDLERAIDAVHEALKLTADDDPQKAGRLYNLSRLLGLRYSQTEQLGDLQESIVNFESALHQERAETIIRARAGMELTQHFVLTSQWAQAYKAAEETLALIPKLTHRSIHNSDRQHILMQVAGFASDAAALAGVTGQDPFKIINLLETGRGVLASNIQEIRTDIAALKEKHPLLAERFSRLRNKLDSAAIQDSHNLPENTQYWHEISQRYETSKGFDELIDEIRQHPGFERFLLALNEAEIKHAARCGPIVVVNVSEIRCDAILIQEHDIQLLFLPHLKFEDVQKRVEENARGKLETLEWLWDTVANLVLSALGFNATPTDDWPRIWWIPTGPLIRFPLHAAGHHNAAHHETVLDRVVSSYSSPVKTIEYSRRGPLVLASNQMLAVAMEHTSGHSNLPFVTKELGMLRETCKSMSFDLIEHLKTREDIKSTLPQCSIFHFAGHGHTDTKDPSKSHLLLEGVGDSITVADLLETNIHQQLPFLAYLSACGTGQIYDDDFIDEHIHLISGCQLAGYRHVIGTLWEVDDELCVEMSRMVYEELKDLGINDASVSWGLHKAMRTLRGQWLSNGGRQLTRESTKVEPVYGVVESFPDDKKHDSLPRNIVMLEDEVTPHWVPYVHFGV